MSIRWYLIGVLWVFSSVAFMFVANLRPERFKGVASERIVAYYQTSGAHPVAMDRVLGMFRRWLPDSELLVHSDGGGPKLDALSRLYGIRNYTYTAQRSSAVSDGLYFRSPEAGADYLERLAKAARTAPWVLLLEDDVGIHGWIDTRQFKYDINAHCRQYFEKKIADFIRPGGNGRVCYSGCGGSVIRSSGLLSANRTVERVAEIIRAKSPDPLGSDELLSAVILLHGGTIGSYRGYTELPFLPGMVVQHYKYGY